MSSNTTAGLNLLLSIKLVNQIDQGMFSVYSW